MQWTVRLEARTGAGEVKTTELVTISRPAMVSTLAEFGLMLDETKALLAKLQANIRRGSKAGYSWSRLDVAGSGDATLMFSDAVRDGSMCWRSSEAARG